MSRRRFAIVVASVAMILSAIRDHAARPAYLAYPSAQPYLMPITGFVDILRWPLYKPADVVSRLFPGDFVWPILFPTLLLGMYYALGLGIHALWTALAGRRSRDGEPVDPARREFLSRGAGLAAGAIGAVGGYSMLAEPWRIELTHRLIRLRGLPPQLAGLRAVQLTDLHHGEWVPAEFLRRAVAMANDARPDIVLLTGDYATHGRRPFVRPAGEIMAGLRPRLGTISVFGNHDWRGDVELMRKLLDRAGVHRVDNGRCFLVVDGIIRREACEGLCIAGIGDAYESTQDYEAALGGVPAGTPRVLLSHNPDVAEYPELAESGLRVDLIIAGHTHGGQIRLPLLGTPGIPSQYGQKYASGLVQGPVCPVFISRGLGLAVLPLRWGVPPEIAVLEFHPA